MSSVNRESYDDAGREFSFDVNSVTLSGRVSTDPILKSSYNQGRRFLEFDLAYAVGDATRHVQIVSFGGIERFHWVRKGMHVVIYGGLGSHIIVDKDNGGEEFVETNVVAQQIRPFPSSMTREFNGVARYNEVV